MSANPTLTEAQWQRLRGERFTLNNFPTALRDQLLAAGWIEVARDGALGCEYRLTRSGWDARLRASAGDR